MKLFRVWTNDYSYDEYDSFICLANSVEEARKLVPGDYGIRFEDGIHFLYGDGTFEKEIEQFSGWPHDLAKIHVEEIDISCYKEPTVLLSSFNAG